MQLQAMQARSVYATARREQQPRQAVLLMLGACFRNAMHHLLASHAKLGTGAGGLRLPGGS
jgi:hypothetical protein